MKSTCDYLDDLKAKYQISSDNKLSDFLGLTRSAISTYRTGRSWPDDDLCLRIAELLEIDELQFIATVRGERTRDEKVKTFWTKIAGAAAGVILSAGTAGAVAMSRIAEIGIQQSILC